jgi:hypothetical protein
MPTNRENTSSSWVGDTPATLRVGTESGRSPSGRFLIDWHEYERSEPDCAGFPGIERFHRGARNAGDFTRKERFYE